LVIDPKTAAMVPAELVGVSSEKIEKVKASVGHFNVESRVSDSIGFIQQFALRQELKTESLIKE
jgi:hypothetical protein